MLMKEEEKKIIDRVCNEMVFSSLNDVCMSLLLEHSIEIDKKSIKNILYNKRRRLSRAGVNYAEKMYYNQLINNKEYQAILNDKYMLKPAEIMKLIKKEGIKVKYEVMVQHLRKVRHAKNYSVVRNSELPDFMIEFIKENYHLPYDEVIFYAWKNGLDQQWNAKIRNKIRNIRKESGTTLQKEKSVNNGVKNKVKFVPSIPINELKERIETKFYTGFLGENDEKKKQFSYYAFIDAAWRLGYSYDEIAYILEMKRYAILKSHRIMTTNRKLVREVGFILQDFGLIPIRKLS